MKNLTKIVLLWVVFTAPVFLVAAKKSRCSIATVDENVVYLTREKSWTEIENEKNQFKLEEQRALKKLQGQLEIEQEHWRNLQRQMLYSLDHLSMKSKDAYGKWLTPSYLKEIREEVKFRILKGFQKLLQSWNTFPQRMYDVGLSGDTAINLAESFAAILDHGQLKNLGRLDKEWHETVQRMRMLRYSKKDGLFPVDADGRLIVLWQPPLDMPKVYDIGTLISEVIMGEIQPSIAVYNLERLIPRLSDLDLRNIDQINLRKLDTNLKLKLERMQEMHGDKSVHKKMRWSKLEVASLNQIILFSQKLFEKADIELKSRFQGVSSIKPQ